MLYFAQVLFSRCKFKFVNSERSGDVRCSGFSFLVKKFKVSEMIFVCRFVLVSCICHVRFMP